MRDLVTDAKNLPVKDARVTIGHLLPLTMLRRLTCILSVSAKRGGNPYLERFWNCFLLRVHFPFASIASVVGVFYLFIGRQKTVVSRVIFPSCCKGRALFLSILLAFDISATDEPWALQLQEPALTKWASINSGMK